MAFSIEITPSAFAELASIRAFDQHRIAAAIETQLTHQPTVQTKNRKPLYGAEPSFEHVPPI
jgi:hypothetical protein